MARVCASLFASHLSTRFDYRVRVPVQRSWFQVGLYCNKIDSGGRFGCPYMFSQSDICKSDLTQRGGCAGAFQSILQSRFNGIAGGGIAILVMQVPR